MCAEGVPRAMKMAAEHPFFFIFLVDLNAASRLIDLLLCVGSTGPLKDTGNPKTSFKAHLEG